MIEIPGRDLAEPDASSSRASHQPATDAPLGIMTDELVGLESRALVEVTQRGSMAAEQRTSLRCCRGCDKDQPPRAWEFRALQSMELLV
jgi:hypothetical protein